MSRRSASIGAVTPAAAGIASLLLALREFGIYFINIAMYSDWVGLPQYADQLARVQRTGKVAFYWMICLLLVAIACVVNTIRLLRKRMAMPTE